MTPIPTAVPIDPLPIGYQDDPVGATCTLYGWTCDPSRYAQALSVHVYLNGTTFVGSATADDPNEPAVTALCGGTEPHRWHLNLPLSYRDGLNHSFNSYAIGIDPSGAPNGYNPELNSSPRTINCPLCSSPIPPVNVSNTSACFGSGGLTGSVQVNWGSGTYDVVRRLGAGAPVIIAPARSATHTDLTAACGSTYTYGVQTPAGACGASAIKWAPTAVTVKCNPAPPGRPTAGNVAFGYVDVTDVSNGDNVYRALVPAPGAAPAPPYSQWVGVVIGGRVRDLSANCNPPPQNHYYQARASRGLGANICYADSPPSNAGSCLVSSDWYQTNGNVTANGTVSNAVPITFTTIGLITATNASSVTWGGPLLPVNQFAATAIHSSVVPNNSFATFYNSARTKAGTITPSTATSLIANSATGPIVDGVTYAEYNGGSLNLSATTMTKNMVLIYSGSGDVTITGNITVGTGANTFVLLAKRDIYVDSSVGAASDPSQAVHGDNLQGIYFAGRTFYDKTAADPGGNTLRINGTVIGMGGVVMERVSTINWPKDYFVFNPGYVMNLPTGLRFSTRFFNELAP